ncbi:MAG: sensor histidine kinase [Yoonia sp.]|uniref:sensor histidine kinase n=1 Tax=Yoonia sp. TaxID=2212373 RepID=UPI003EF40227
MAHDKDRFLNLVLHDLKSPLRNILQLGQLAEAQVGAADTAKLTKLMQSQAKLAAQGLDLVTALEVFLKLEQDAQYLPVDLNEVAAEACETLTPMIEDRSANVKIDALPIVQGDPFQLICLFENLIENGLLYNDADKPYLYITHAPAPDGTIQILVGDNGIGVAEKHLEMIFEPLKRLWSVTRYKGVGMGLAICDRITKLHGGQIACTSVAGQGSVFYINFPAITDTDT